MFRPRGNEAGITSTDRKGKEGNSKRGNATKRAKNSGRTANGERKENGDAPPGKNLKKRINGGRKEIDKLRKGKTGGFKTGHEGAVERGPGGCR